MTEPTPGQTVGPFFHLGLPFPGDSALVPAGHPLAVHLRGFVLDGAGDPVPDALVELWQAGPDGATVRETGSLHRDGWTFTGWGRAGTDATGRYTFSTLVPGGPVPFFALVVFARGLTDRLFTRAYLPDAVLPPGIPESLRAVAEPRGFRFDIRLQGENETVFLNFHKHKP
ncbi:protocatechuate 3,4-dioxygenase subunit alpha [Dactylosporangium vinaceum]|uniref:Protocatechuate 3,4-dioxygenase subunit alpha n=1 Tax=Dactylosporangium vinaceum TaxID=53362 RepID=A0ABV5MA49_9ACTN|nr:protocatechuate 3,4-dioxygenase subunit alpha [Dactylosporangium vinaceum]UAB93119.1 protocatechuate 3,4-dioxygenase subunit alpha [Dactylosporangium vinaceum]